ncbi:MAG: KEOPS complex subunit Cgi121 [Candidatus Bathyarchaeia archaeon]|jgi:tRNA threonylcarbamoyladenosine modification (KEOPS) complex Cgi121 subunit
MQHCLEEYAKYAEITGYKNIKFAQAETFLKTNRKETKQNIDIQFFDARLIATYEHLYFAILNALQAFQNKTNISKSLAMETMLYASAQRQIQKAIQRCGIKPETTSMAVIIIVENPTELKAVLQAVTACVGVEPDERVLEMSIVKEKKIKETFQITDEELKIVMKNENREEAIVNLVIERVALLATQL